MSIGRTFTFWTIIFLALLGALQVFPYTGILLMFGMALLGPYLWGFIPHLVTVALLLDVAANKIPKALLILPLMAYGSYYAYYVQEYQVMKSFEKQLRAENPRHVVDYDSTKHSLVMNNGGSLVTSYKFPVIFESNPNFPEGYLSYRLVTQERCNEARSLRLQWVNGFGAFWNRSAKKAYSSKRLKQCQLRMPETATKDILLVNVNNVQEKEKFQDIDFLTTTYKFSYQGKEIGQFKSASIMRLPIFPFYIAGCGLLGSGSWKCSAGFYRSRTPLDTYPVGLQHSQYGKNPVGVLLKVEPYKESDFNDFQDYPENAVFLDAFIKREKSATSEDFDEWGLRKDSLYERAVSEKNGIPSYEGQIYAKKEGGPFFSFIRSNVGKVVSINADIGANINLTTKGFGTYGVCKKEERCDRLDHWYTFENGNGATFMADKSRRVGQIKGLWRVEKIEPHPNGEDLSILLIGAASPE